MVYLELVYAHWLARAFNPVLAALNQEIVLIAHRSDTCDHVSFAMVVLEAGRREGDVVDVTGITNALPGQGVYGRRFMFPQGQIGKV